MYKKEKYVAVILAFLFGPFAWLYTWKVDKKKFWSWVWATVIVFLLGVVIGGNEGLAFFIVIGYLVLCICWLWAFVLSLVRHSEWYKKYGRW